MLRLPFWDIGKCGETETHVGIIVVCRVQVVELNQKIEVVVSSLDPNMQPLLLVLLGILILVSSSPTITYGADKKVLIVGKELWKETIPLQMGNRWYVLQSLKSYTWYEVKISYPASIPAKFAIQLKKNDSDSWMNPARRLLNTEKLIFKTSNLNDDQTKYYVLLTVEPEGFVAIPHVPESQEIMYNIVCDELLLGIPHKAWWVAVLVLLCLGLAFLIPHFLPSYLLSKGSPEVLNQNVTKEH